MEVWRPHLKVRDFIFVTKPTLVGSIKETRKAVPLGTQNISRLHLAQETEGNHSTDGETP